MPEEQDLSTIDVSSESLPRTQRTTDVSSARADSDQADSSSTQEVEAPTTPARSRFFRRQRGKTTAPEESNEPVTDGRADVVAEMTDTHALPTHAVKPSRRAPTQSASTSTRTWYDRLPSWQHTVLGVVVISLWVASAVVGLRHPAEINIQQVVQTQNQQLEERRARGELTEEDRQVEQQQRSTQRPPLRPAAARSTPPPPPTVSTSTATSSDLTVDTATSTATSTESGDDDVAATTSPATEEANEDTETDESSEDTEPTDEVSEDTDA